MQKQLDQLLRELVHIPKSEPLGMARFSERERGEKLGTRSFVSDWCRFGLHNPSPYIGMRSQGFYHLGGRRGHHAFNQARPTALTQPRMPQINFISTNYNSWHFIPGMKRTTRKLPNSVILSYHQTNITLSQEKYYTPNHPKHHQWHTFLLCHTLYHLIIRSV